MVLEKIHNKSLYLEFLPGVNTNYKKQKSELHYVWKNTHGISIKFRLLVAVDTIRISRAKTDE
jgi:hypothetical protein